MDSERSDLSGFYYYETSSSLMLQAVHIFESSEPPCGGACACSYNEGFRQ